MSFRIPEIIASLPMLLFTALVLFVVGLIDFLCHLNKGIAIVVSVLFGVVLIAHVVTTMLPIFTPRSPFKTPLSNWIGGLWWYMKGGSGSLYGYEMSDVDRQRARLEGECIFWIKNSTKRLKTFHDAIRAGQEFERSLLKSYYGEVGGFCEPSETRG
jgi:hypothetical protein